MPAADNCSAAGCESIVGPRGAKGFCPFHYNRFRATGDPLVSAMDLVQMERPCPACGEAWKPRNSLARQCDACKKVKSAEYNREWARRNPGYHLAWKRAHAEDGRAYSAAYREKNPERVRAAYKRWEAANPDHARIWVEKNRELAREIVRRRRSRVRIVPTFEVTSRDIRRLLARHGNACAYCGQQLGSSYHMDHVVPVSMGGSNGIGNLLPSCATCNISKSNWFLSEWRYKDRLSKPLRRKSAKYSRAA